MDMRKAVQARTRSMRETHSSKPSCKIKPMYMRPWSLLRGGIITS